MYLSYLATTKEDIDEICTALPIVENAAKQNVVWKQLCQRRWKDKWGYKMRWERALENFTLQPDEHYWMNVYNNEEEDAKRNYLTRDELCNLTFDWRDWFDMSPEKGLLSTGLRRSLVRDIVFSNDGNISSNQRVHFSGPRTGEPFYNGPISSWNANNDDNITHIRLSKIYPMSVFSVIVDQLGMGSKK